MANQSSYSAQKLDDRRKLYLLQSQLEIERGTFQAHWRELADFVAPRRQRFLITDVNKGDRRNQKIIDGAATLALRTLRAGMVGGVSSPARPWFSLKVPDPDLNEFGPVKDWLHTVTDRMRTVFLKSSLYNALPIVYGDMGLFGTGCCFMEEDFDNVIRYHVFPIGSYSLATDSKGRVRVFAREFQMTVRQIVEKFGTTREGKEDFEMISSHAKSLWESGQTEAWIKVCHIIMPNPNHDSRRSDSKFKKFMSTYYESGHSSVQKDYFGPSDEGKLLRESGYDYFPVLAPRWETTGGDVYGTSCPGMDALGDIKQLQTMQKRKSQAVEKMINPPLIGPTSLKTSKVSILPGDINFNDTREGLQGLRAVHDVNFRIEPVTNDIKEIKYQISRAFYEDLFLMLAQSDRRQITAREIEERHEEKLLALGPVLEQLNQDALDPCIDNAFIIMERQGLIPKAPKELEGMDLKIEYTSIMAQAQKLIGLAGIERFTGFVTSLAGVNPEVLDKIDTDEMVDEYGDIVSVKPNIIRTEEEVEKIRAQRAKAQQAAAQAEMIQRGAGAAKDLSQANMEGDNALTRLMDQGNAGALA